MDILAESFINEINYILTLKNTKLQKLNPDAILKLGYAKVIKDNNAITSINETSVGDEMSVVFADGKIDVIRR